jgi:NlpC/P60 family
MYPSRLHVGRRALLGLLSLVLGVTVTSALVAPPASADAARPHDAIGAVSTLTAVPGGLTATGWAADPDALTTNLTISGVIDGRVIAASALTSVANQAVTTKYHTGPTPGFTLTIPVPSGSHTVCVVTNNLGSGLQVPLKCVVTPLGSTLTAAQLAAHKPVGAISQTSVTSTTLRLSGWASDPDWIARRSIVVLYVDGRSVATVTTHQYPTSPRPAAAGWASAFDISVPVSVGAHQGCIWVVNLGLGSNSFLGCRHRDTRGPSSTGTFATPPLNTKVVAEAQRHIGQSYVWGATGPSTFDCSGLVKYSYGKNGYTTPRISEDQFTAARLIPASRARPGDLVFTYDTQGDVYHVGIYVSPGRTVAAIDEAEGVNYQTIWDPSMTTYGSLTHT